MYEEWKFSEGLDKYIIEKKEELGLTWKQVRRRVLLKALDLEIFDEVGEYAEHTD